MKNSAEFWKKPLCFITFFLLSHCFTNCYFSFSLKGSPLSLLLYCTKLSIFSLFLLKPIPAWYYSRIWLLLPWLYGCSKPAASCSRLERKREMDRWFVLLTSPYPCPAINVAWTEFLFFLSLLSQWWGRDYRPPSRSGLWAGNCFWLATLSNMYWSFQKYLSLPVYSS